MIKNSFHRRWASGIDGNEKEGTAAIFLSGGYEDDEDQGEQIIYTGAGGNDQNTKKKKCFIFYLNLHYATRFFSTKYKFQW